MKKIANLYESGAYWKVFLLSSFLITVIGLIFTSCIIGQNALFLPMFIKLSFFVGLICGLMISLMTMQARHSALFWKVAKEFENKLIQADSNQKICELIQNDYYTLRKLANGSPQFFEIGRLSSMLIIKEKTLEKKETKLYSEEDMIKFAIKTTINNWQDYSLLKTKKWAEDNLHTFNSIENEKTASN